MIVGLERLLQRMSCKPISPAALSRRPALPASPSRPRVMALLHDFLAQLNEERSRTDLYAELIGLSLAPATVWRWKSLLPRSAIAAYSLYCLLLVLGE